MQIGDIVLVDFVRSNYLDPENGIGWTANNVEVVVDRVNDLSFCFWFNNEYHYCLKSECKEVKNRNLSLFEQADKIRFAKNNIDYRLKVEYGV